jgi:hypothetical protein
MDSYNLDKKLMEHDVLLEKVISRDCLLKIISSRIKDLCSTW